MLRIDLSSIGFLAMWLVRNYLPILSKDTKNVQTY